MARHRSFSFEFKRQVVLDFLEDREGMRELTREHCLSRNLIRLWVQKYEAGELTDEVVEVGLAQPRRERVGIGHALQQRGAGVLGDVAIRPLAFRPHHARHPRQREPHAEPWL